MPEQKTIQETQQKIPRWDCQLDWASVEQITVGTFGNLTCTGGFVSAFIETKDKTKALIVFPEGTSKHALKVLKVKQLEATRADFVITSHKAGDFQNQKIQVLNAEGTLGFESQGLNWKVQSLLDPRQPTEPIGSFGPSTLPWPPWLVILLVIFVGFWLGFGFLKLFTYSKYRKLLKQLKRQGTSLTPYQAFNKSLRTFRKSRLSLDKVNSSGDDGKNSASQEIIRLQEIFNEYITSIFIIPSRELSQKQLTKKIKGRIKSNFKKIEKSLAHLLREFECSKETQTLASKDVEQVIVMTQKLVDSFEKLDKNKRRNP